MTDNNRVNSLAPKKSDFTDQLLVCSVCADPFLLEAGEQAFFKRRGLAVPTRCPVCRKQHTIKKLVDSK